MPSIGTKRFAVIFVISPLYFILDIYTYLVYTLTLMYLLTYFLQGYITTKDLAKLTKKLSREEVGALMTKLDTDGDGQLSFDEFKEMLPTKK